MDAIVLVGGQGTRLRPLTHTRHKSLVPVCNRPAIEYLFDWLGANGIDRAVLALGQANEDLAESYPAGKWGGIEILPVIETQRLESGGGIRNAVREAGIEGRYLVVNGDIFVDFDLHAAVAQHESTKAELTLALTDVPDPSQFGVAVVGGASLVTGFVEKPPPGTAPSKLVNAGVWIFEAHLTGEIHAGAVRVEETLFPSLVGRGRRVLGYRFPGIWADIGTPARYLELNRRLLAAGRDGIAAGCAIDAGARVLGSSLGEGTHIEADATVADSIAWERVEVEAGATVSGSILADGVRVCEGANVDGAVVGSGATIGAGARLTRGTLVDPGATV